MGDQHQEAPAASYADLCLTALHTMSVFVCAPDALLSPGDFGMDPLNLTSNPSKKARFELNEIQHCRLAMMAISGIATQSVLNGGAFPYTG